MVCTSTKMFDAHTRCVVVQGLCLEAGRQHHPKTSSRISTFVKQEPRITIRQRKSNYSRRSRHQLPSKQLHATAGVAGETWFEFSTPEGQTMTHQDSLTVMTALQRAGCGDLARPVEQCNFPGSLNESYLVRAAGGSRYFVKVNTDDHALNMFLGEKASLQYLAATAEVRVPAPLGVGPLQHGGAYLIMEGLDLRPFAMLEAGAQRRLGEGLARLHLAHRTRPHLRQEFGFPVQTFLGMLPLENEAPANEAAGEPATWQSFFVQQRLAERLAAAAARFGELDEGFLQRATPGILEHASEVLRGHCPAPAMLHGDLWVGNCGVARGGDGDGDGEAAIFDPAGFVGDAEFDLAFRDWPAGGGFPGLSEDFHQAYHAVLPQEPGFQDRHDLYQLFHLLNHLCIYGLEYYPFVKQAAKRMVG